jgi:hypothetical protein
MQLGPLSKAEDRFVRAVRNHQWFDFSDDGPIRPDEMVQWGDDRRIRASVLKEVLPPFAQAAIAAIIIAAVSDAAAISTERLSISAWLIRPSSDTEL